MNIQIINGPNLNLLGLREPEIYGTETLDQIETWLKNETSHLGVTMKCFQSNHEGAVIDAIHECRDWADGLIINPGAFTHYSYAIRDAVSAVGIPTVEVHLSDIETREDFRKISVIKDVCRSQIMGLGKHGYLKAIEKLCQ